MELIYVVIFLIVVIIVLALKIEVKREKISELRSILHKLTERDNGTTESFVYATYYSMLFKQALLEIKDLNKLCDETFAVYKKNGGLIEQETLIHIEQAKATISADFPRKHLDSDWLSFKDIKRFNLIFKKKYDDLKLESKF